MFYKSIADSEDEPFIRKSTLELLAKLPYSNDEIGNYFDLEMIDIALGGYACNAKCHYCFGKDFPRIKTIITKDNYKIVHGNYLNYTNPKKDKWINKIHLSHYNSDPLLDPLLPYIIDYIDEHSIHTGMLRKKTMISNGILLHQNVGIISSGIDNLSVSINAATAAQYYENYGVDEFENVLRGLQEIRKQSENIIIDVNYVLLRNNLDGLSEFVKQLRDIGVNKVMFRRNLFDKDLMRMDEGIKIVTMLYKEMNKNDFRVVSKEKGEKYINENNICLSGLGQGAMIDPWGYVKQCMHAIGYGYGNLFINTLQEIIRNKFSHLPDAYYWECKNSCPSRRSLMNKIAEIYLLENQKPGFFNELGKHTPIYIANEREEEKFDYYGTSFEKMYEAYYSQVENSNFMGELDYSLEKGIVLDDKSFLMRDLLGSLFLFSAEGRFLGASIKNPLSAENFGLENTNKNIVDRPTLPPDCPPVLANDIPFNIFYRDKWQEVRVILNNITGEPEGKTNVKLVSKDGKVIAKKSDDVVLKIKQGEIISAARIDKEDIVKNFNKPYSVAEQEQFERISQLIRIQNNKLNVALPYAEKKGCFKKEYFFYQDLDSYQPVLNETNIKQTLTNILIYFKFAQDRGEISNPKLLDRSYLLTLIEELLREVSLYRGKQAHLNILGLLMVYLTSGESFAEQLKNLT